MEIGTSLKLALVIILLNISTESDSVSIGAHRFSNYEKNTTKLTKYIQM